MKIKKSWFALFTIPLLATFCVVVLVPFFAGIGYSFIQWDGIPKNAKTFVGFANYARAFTDRDFLVCIGRTALFTVITVAIVNVLALAFALIVTSHLRTRNVARTTLANSFKARSPTSWPCRSLTRLK